MNEIKTRGDINQHDSSEARDVTCVPSVSASSAQHNEEIPGSD